MMPRDSLQRLHDRYLTVSHDRERLPSQFELLKQVTDHRFPIGE